MGPWRLASHLVLLRSWTNTEHVSASTDIIDRHLPGETRILEVGCGSTPHPRTTIGLDHEHAASRAAATQTRVVTGDATRLPFARHSFTAVLARGVCHHLTDLAAFLTEAARVLQHDGQLLILDAEPMPARDFDLMTQQLTRAGLDPEPRNGLDPAMLHRTATALGYSRLHSHPTGRWTHATPPHAEREFSSPAHLHILQR